MAASKELKFKDHYTTGRSGLICTADTPWGAYEIVRRNDRYGVGRYSVRFNGKAINYGSGPKSSHRSAERLAQSHYWHRVWRIE